MFENYSPIETYMYLECLFLSLSFGLLIAKVGIEPIKLIIREVLRNVKQN